MARVTVEDCLEQVENRFALVLIAAQRTRQIIKGSSTLLELERDNKEAVIALREIADGLVPYSIEAAPSEEEVEQAVMQMQKENDDGTALADDTPELKWDFSGTTAATTEPAADKKPGDASGKEG